MSKYAILANTTPGSTLSSCLRPVDETSSNEPSESTLNRWERAGLIEKLPPAGACILTVKGYSHFDKLPYGRV